MIRAQTLDLAIRAPTLAVLDQADSRLRDHKVNCGVGGLWEDYNEVIWVITIGVPPAGVCKIAVDQETGLCSTAGKKLDCIHTSCHILGDIKRVGT